MNVSPFEICMLVCFGASWPISVLKTYTMKSATGKSFLFLWLIFIGYISGCIHKLLYVETDWVIFLYIINGLLVFLDIQLAYRYRKLDHTQKQPPEIS